MESKSKKKATVNLSIDAQLLQELRKEASSQNLSLNAKINSVLTKYVYFYRHAAQLECIVCDPKVFLAFLDYMHDEEKIADILWNEGGLSVLSFFNHYNIPLTLENVIKYIYDGIAFWSGQYSFFSHYKDSEGYTCLVFDHKFGIKWSRVLARLHSKTFEHWLGMKSVTKITSKTVVLKLLEREINVKTNVL